MRQWGIEYEPDQQHVSCALKALGLTDARGVATPGTDDAGGPKASEISELRRTAKWRDLPGEIDKEDDLRTGEELKLFQSAAARFNFLAVVRPDLLYSVKELMRKMASARTRPNTQSNIHEWLANTYGLQWTVILRFWRCKLCWMYLYEKVHSWRSRDVEQSVLKAWSETMGVLALGGGESELATVVRAATEGFGLHSILERL